MSGGLMLLISRQGGCIMKKMSFSEELQFAKKHGYAVGAFNIFSYLSAVAVVHAANELDVPVILQTSASTVKKFGSSELGGMLRQIAQNAPVNVLIHLDHCREVELAKACIEAGWNSVMFDGSRLEIEENIALCREVADYAHSRGVDVEGELGIIAGVEDYFSVEEDDASATEVEEAVRFVRDSGIDALAPAIGTAHGVYKGVPKINFRLMEELRDSLAVPIVVHGGTGLSEDTFRKLIGLGAAKINVSTAIKHAYMDSSREYLKKNPDGLDPLEYDAYMHDSIRDTARRHLQIFCGNRRAD